MMWMIWQKHCAVSHKLGDCRRYITSDEAKRQGWSGNETETLWGIKPTNNKWIGGDNYVSSKLPSAQSWFSADIDVSKGYGGPND
jgi:hypothetical protein